MRPTVHLRRRNELYPDGFRGTLDQLWVNDDQTKWEWREVPLVHSDNFKKPPMKGDGPPPISGVQHEEPS